MKIVNEYKMSKHFTKCFGRILYTKYKKDTTCGFSLTIKKIDGNTTFICINNDLLTFAIIIKLS